MFISNISIMLGLLVVVAFFLFTCDNKDKMRDKKKTSEFYTLNERRYFHWKPNFFKKKISHTKIAKGES